MALYKYYKFPWRQGNHFETLVDSGVFFPRMLDAIDSARQYVLLEMYLVSSGVIADRFISSLLAAAEREVQIYLLLDDFGAQKLEQNDRKRLEHPDIHIVYYNPLHSYSTIYNLYRILWHRITHGLYRNHRKLLLVDDRLAYTGGAGITDEEDAPREPEMRWRETMVEIQGPILGDWQQLFNETWNQYAEQPLTLPELKPFVFANGQAGRVAVNEARIRMGIQRSLLKRLGKARRRIWFATAYFIPSWSIRRKLKRAASAGVDVRILLPGSITDHPGVRHVSHRYYGGLLRKGVRIYEYAPRFFHSKTVLCDDWVTIGSCNYDRWNLEWNLEASQEISDENLAATVAAIFENDLADSFEFSYEKWERRNWRLRALEWFWRGIELLSLKIKNRRRP